MLDHGGLYFPALSALGDKLEGAPSRLSEGATEADRLIALAQFSQVRCSVFVNCWYMFKDESSAMWSLYGDQGVAIRTTYSRLVGSITARSGTRPLSDDRELRDGIVEYVDPGRKTTPSVPWRVLRAVIEKRHWYQHEREFRLIYVDGKLGEFEFVPNNPPNSSAKQGEWVYCSLSQMISAIVVAPQSPHYLEEVVRSVCEKFGLNPRIVRRSRIEERPPSPLTGVE